MIKKAFHFVLVLMLSVSMVPLFHAKATETESGVEGQPNDNTTVTNEDMPPETEEPVFSLEENREEAIDAATEVQPRSNMLRASVTATSFQQKFINSISSQAMELCKKYKLYPSVMIAQASLESNWGRSELGTAPNYNLFGIKGSYNGKSVTMKTWEYSDSKGWYQIDAKFAKYPSYKESLEDNAKKLRNGPSWDSSYYKGAWRENAKTYKDATAWLQGRYATDNTYASKLNSLISQYNLTQYDKLYDTIKSQKNVSEDAKVVKADGHGVYSGIYNTSAASGKKLSTGAPYNNKNVKILKEGTTSRGTWVQFSSNNKVIGWMDKRAFVYYPKATNVKSLNLTGKITAGSTNGLWSEVPGTVNAKKLATTAGAYQNKDAKIIKQGQISGRTYYQFQVGGKTIGWLDARAFHVYDTIKSQSNVNWNRTILNADKHGVYSGVYNTSASSMNKLSTGAKYNNKKVKVIKQAQTARGTWYQFQVNGKTVGWMDYRAFFDTITSQKTMNKTVTVGNATNHGVFDGVYRTSPKVKRISLGKPYNNKKVQVLKEAVTDHATWVQFKYGKTVAWMDKKAFKY
ncbi:GW domain-containing glycosaminoglycan-binding protein [Listeria seeligeri]|uniref:GW domain-containing glycosaminoglycan-binding protein n=1 Tax=Listeria seeligeri TaxID=1640 RepID=UPI0010DBCD25|nr:GW domain-containing glycosaminoglycan-binding protein [Listeria seeligeri]MBC1421761.1 GW domain-containing glycosaminoglycan-binding protein [Listeria seeligeri]MBC1444290.1 GW domain-containing glycosaminoglycan-binding protein [Listeria seeligeri]MBC1528602.1 GW domain-containing glycosaminoglycan-binding protein [Listeria seeligeri]MBC1541596.1 GW domain-containing glycosaminoglycan-binding protein [Listeria seeligeri]MBC1584168.1 GW domain-containing glycosaminoglycan-binding protein 